MRRNTTAFVTAVGLFTTLWLRSFSPLSAEVHDEIDDHLRNNRFSEARSLIQVALIDYGHDPNLYLRLAAISEYQGNHREAITTLRSGVEATSSSVEVFHYNIGNNYFALRRYDDAERAYSSAIESDSAYEPPYINRANTRVWNEDYVGAIEDYTHYLAIAPQGEYRAEVRRMVAVLRALLGAEEARERERITREKQLLDDALFLLEGSHNDGLNSRAPSADINELDDELDIID